MPNRSTDDSVVYAEAQALVDRANERVAARQMELLRAGVLTPGGRATSGVDLPSDEAERLFLELLRG